MDPSSVDIDALTRILYGDPDHSEVEVPPEQITAAENYSHASWAWMQAQFCEERAREIELEVRRLILQLEDRLGQIAGPWKTRQAGYLRMVELWHRGLRAEDPKAPKTVEFPTGGSSKLRAQQPVMAGHPDHEQLMAWVDGETTKEGTPLMDAVYPVKKPGPDEQFKVSQLNKVAAPKVPDGAEPGTFVPLVHRDTAEVVPGVSYIVREDRWDTGE